jgi:hypothetical protein
MKSISALRLASFLFLFVCSTLYTRAQNYYITTDQDSVVCRSINYFDTNAQGKMIKLEYVNTDNQTILLHKNDIPEIARLCQDGAIYVRMPLKISKPDGYYRYGKRMVNGKITVDVFDDVQTSYRLKENFDGSYSNEGVMKETREGIYMRHVRMPDGTVYEISGLKALKPLKKIQEYMFACEVYEKEYYTNPKYQTCTFEEAVSDYNRMCP